MRLSFSSFLIRSQILRLINISKTMHSEKTIYQFANVGCYPVFYSSIFIKNVTWTLSLYCLEGDFNGKEMASISHTHHSCSSFVYFEDFIFFYSRLEYWTIEASVWLRLTSERLCCVVLVRMDKVFGAPGSALFGLRFLLFKV